MTIQVTIRNDEAEGSTAAVKVTVVTVGSGTDVQDRHELLSPGQQATVAVGPGQFVMVDDKEL